MWVETKDSVKNKIAKSLVLVAEKDGSVIYRTTSDAPNGWWKIYRPKAKNGYGAPLYFDFVICSDLEKGGKHIAKEGFVDFVKERYPEDFEYLLFHPEYLNGDS